MSIPPLAIATFWIALILVMTAGFLLFMRKWAAQRRRIEEKSANQMLAEFRDLHARGTLSDEEYARIREGLGPQVQEEAQDGVSAGSTAEAAEELKQTARSLLSGWGGGEGPAASSGGADGSERSGRPNQSGTSDPGRDAAQEGCDAEPPDGGDSTK